MLLLQSVAILCLLFVCTFAPGLFLVRRLRWSAMEKLCGGAALSLILLWLFAWTAYLTDAGTIVYYAFAAVCAGLAIFQARDLFRGSRVRHVLLGFAFLLAWTLLALTIIHVYDGARWSGDWLEHFQRTLFFLHHFPTNTPIFGNYRLPARPPAENVIAAFFLRLVADRFELFQIVFAFLNLLVFLAGCLALPLLARSRRFSIVPLAGIFATSPIVMENATYTWTKLLTAFFVLTALVFYLKGWRRNDSTRIVFAFGCLAMGLLVHYSAGPYIVFFALHYLIAVFPKRPRRVRELAQIAAVSGVLLATWFGWSVATFGANATVASNTSITASQEYQGSNLGKIAANIADSVVPHWLRNSALVRFFDQPNQTGALRDNIFITYQVQLLFTMGAVGGFLVAWLLIAAFRGRWGRPSERTFWLWLLIASVSIGLAVVGERDPFGSAHLTLLPMEVLGLTLLAARFRQSRTLAMLIVAGCAIDFGLGVFLHLRMQRLENFTGPVVMNGQVVIVPPPDALSDSARENWSRKYQLVNALEWRRELENASAQGKPEVLAILDKMIAEDAQIFHGWYQRHGGKVEYLGDHFGDGDLSSGLLLMVCAGLLWRMARCIPPPAPLPLAAPAKSKPARGRGKR